MNKLFKSLLISIIALFLFAGTGFAADSTSIRLQQPQSPTNKDAFNITFVALDTNSGQPVTVQCYKKGPSDGGFVTFGSPINLSNGGNTDNCQVSSGVMNQGNGTYQFNAVVTTGSTTPTSNTVSVDFNNSTPGTPVNYKKEKPEPCTYKIWFRTADDSGKTVKVRLYRSTETNFSVDSAHQVNEISIGSSTDGSMTDNISPNCNTTYYYVVRAFDIYGNGSGVVGDENITTNITNPTTTTQGAIPVSGTGSVLGAGTGGEDELDKEVLGTESAEESTEADTTDATQASQNPVANAANWISSNKLTAFVVFILLVAIGFYLFRRFKK